MNGMFENNFKIFSGKMACVLCKPEDVARHQANKLNNATKAA